MIIRVGEEGKLVEINASCIFDPDIINATIFVQHIGLPHVNAERALGKYGTLKATATIFSC